MKLTKQEKILIYDLVRLELKTWHELTKKDEWDLNYIKELEVLKKKLAEDLFGNLDYNN